MATPRIPDWMPNNRKDIALMLAGAGIALGATQIPGFTIEPKAATQCRVDLASCKAADASHVEDLKKADERIQKCWEQYRISFAKSQP